MGVCRHERLLKWLVVPFGLPLNPPNMCTTVLRNTQNGIVTVSFADGTPFQVGFKGNKKDNTLFEGPDSYSF